MVMTLLPIIRRMVIKRRQMVSVVGALRYNRRRNAARRINVFNVAWLVAALFRGVARETDKYDWRGARLKR